VRCSRSGTQTPLLGPALPYIRSVERISYLVGVLHQVAYAVGGGLVGALSSRNRPRLRRQAVIPAILAGAAFAAFVVGYGNSALITVAGALVMGLLGTLALIRLWAVLSDRHGSRRAVALSEGEVAVSFAGVAVPLLIAGSPAPL
jgi:hypothetical protein